MFRTTPRDRWYSDLTYNIKNFHRHPVFELDKLLSCWDKTAVIEKHFMVQVLTSNLKHLDERAVCAAPRWILVLSLPETTTTNM
jgi:hypothetical protein